MVVKTFQNLNLVRVCFGTREGCSGRLSLVYPKLQQASAYYLVYFEISNQMELRYLMLKIIKGNPFYKNHSNQHNSKTLQQKLVPFGYVHIDTKRQLLSLLIILRQQNKMASYTSNGSTTTDVSHLFYTFLYTIGHLN